jgi:Tfp pilus assembly protein PilX
MPSRVTLGIDMNLKFNPNLTQPYQPYFAKQAYGTKQQGMVLFFALIALVVMSLAAVALIRSVDTNTMIAGNLGFKQSATVSADSGVETAIDWLGANQTILTANNTAMPRP